MSAGPLPRRDGKARVVIPPEAYDAARRCAETLRREAINVAFARLGATTRAVIRRAVASLPHASASPEPRRR